MAEIGFYHLRRARPEQALGQLLNRTLDAGQRAVLRCRDAAQVRALNAALWKLEDAIWLPHGSKTQGDGQKQPIWLTHEIDAPNGASFLFILSHASTEALQDYQRVFIIFDGDDHDSLIWARTVWQSHASDPTHRLTYWQQTEKGWAQKRSHQPPNDADTK